MTDLMFCFVSDVLSSTELWNDRFLGVDDLERVDGRNGK